MGNTVKPFTSIEEQIKILISRGLELDHALAQQWLKNIGYYRLSGYWFSYRLVNKQSSLARSDYFVSGSNFNDVTKLYEFDRKLRTLIHDGIERVEVTLRSHLSDLLGSYGPLAYHNQSLFRPSFDHQLWLSTAESRMNRALRHNESIKHNKAKYGGNLPIWVYTEILDFADISKLYEGLRTRDQWLVAERLGVKVTTSCLTENQHKKALKSHPLTRWFEHLTILRNTCAHHGRVWNRSFTPVSTTGLRTIKNLQSLPKGQSERLYGALLVMGHLLQTASPGSTWAWKIRTLVEDSFMPLPHRSLEEMGFPTTWRAESLWSRPSLK